MDFGKLLGLGVVGGVGWWLYKQYSTSSGLFAPAVPAGTPATSSGTPATTPAQTATTPAPPAPTPATVSPVYARWVAYAAAHNLTGKNLTVDQWNWYFVQATGYPGPAPEDIGISRDPSGATALMPYGEYLNVMSGWIALKGFAGFGQGHIPVRRGRVYPVHGTSVRRGRVYPAFRPSANYVRVG